MRAMRIFTTVGLFVAMAWPANAQTTPTCFGQTPPRPFWVRPMLTASVGPTAST